MTRWLGTWRLRPELTIGGEEPPVEEGTYRIADKDGMLVFTINWRQGGKTFEVEFEAAPDGRKMPSAQANHDAYAVLAEDERTLSGAAWLKGRQIARALRRVSADGRLMSILQEAMPETGPPVRVFQVYERVDG